MDHGNINSKRLKTASGAPISAPRPTPSGSVSLPQYQPPAPRSSASPAPPSSASLSRANPANGGKGSLKLTVKAPPSKLRQATSGSQFAGSTIPPSPYTADTPASDSDATPAPAPRAARSTRNPRTVVEPDSDEDEEMEDAVGEEEDEEQDEDDEEDEEEEDEIEEDVDDELANEDSEEDAEGEEDDDVIEAHPPRPVIKQEKAPGRGRPSVTVSAPNEGPLKSVEAKEMEDDDELSELESGDENDVNDDEEEEDEEDSNSDMDGSGSGTPDLSKLTRRQRGGVTDFEGDLMALSNEAQKKKHISAEEHAMRRAEMARRRKNLSEKKNEEEKMDTINKLLKKPAPKRRTRAEILAAQQAGGGTPGAEDGDEDIRPDPLYVRWVNNKAGSKLSVPAEWTDAPLANIFANETARGRTGGRMVEEVA